MFWLAWGFCGAAAFTYLMATLWVALLNYFDIKMYAWIPVYGVVKKKNGLEQGGGNKGK